MDIPLIRKFACGYVQGVKDTNPDAEVFQNMTGTTGAAWNDPVKGGELAKSQIDRGADVVYHAAGGTGVGVLQAAADAGKLGIGVDSNQNYIHPGQVLTSMLKRVDLATYDAMMDVQNDDWSAGLQVMGVAEDGVGYAVDENNEALITPEMAAAVEEAKAKIIAGEIEVHDYTSDDSCPVS
jgi:basic membrane protein A